MLELVREYKSETGEPDGPENLQEDWPLCMLFNLFRIKHFVFIQSLFPLKFFGTTTPVSFRFVFDRYGCASIVFWFPLLELQFIFLVVCLFHVGNAWLQSTRCFSGHVTPVFFEKKWLPGRRGHTPPVSFRFIFDYSGCISIAFWFTLIELLFIYIVMSLKPVGDAWLQSTQFFYGHVTQVFLGKKWLPGRRVRSTPV